MDELGAVILTGGAASRMGQDKALMLWAGRTAVDRVAQIAGAVGAKVVLTVGGQGDYGYPQAVEATAFGGPVGGVLAGMAALRAAGCARALVLAVDAPTLEAEDLAPLIAHGAPGARYAGLHLPLVMALDAVPADASAGWPMARLAEGLVKLDCPEAARARVRGANTPEERDALLAALGEREPG